MASEIERADFAASLNQFITWLFAEGNIALSRRQWFDTQIGLDSKYLNRWLAGSHLPSETSWAQFSRKLKESKPPTKELDSRLEELGRLLRHIIKKQRQAQLSGAERVTSGIENYFSDFVDIVEPWQQMCNDSRNLDLLVMYASSWRNTYLKYVREMLNKPQSRLRVVLPALTGPLLQAYSARLATSTDILAGRIRDAVIEFKALGEFGHVEIYATTSYINHALYLFDVAGVLAWFSFRTDRCPTPAVLVRNGDLLQFLRTDFAWLISRRNSATRLLYRSKK